MTSQTNQVQTPDSKPTDKELNFRQLEAKYERQLQQQKEETDRLKRELEERNRSESKPQSTEEEEDAEPYVDHKRLKKTLNNFGQNTQTEIQKAMKMAKDSAKEELKQEMWLENNPDFYDVLQHAEKFAQKAPKLAATILRMPEGFERQKLVYENIKQLEIDKPEQKQPTIQDKIDANRKSPYYQPTNISSAPYAGSQSDYSPNGQKQAYDKMQELKNRLRLG